MQELFDDFMGFLPNLIGAAVIFGLVANAIALVSYGAYLVRNKVMPEPSDRRKALTWIWLLLACLPLLVGLSLSINVLRS